MAKRRSLHGTGREALAAAAETAGAERPSQASAPAIKRPPGTIPSAEGKPPDRARAVNRVAGSGPVRYARRPERHAGQETRQSPFLAWPAGFGWWDSAGALASANAALVRSAVAMCEEMFGFANARLRANIETSETLRRCTSPAEMLETQAEYARTAAEQYLAAPMKLMELAARTGGGWAAMPWRAELPSPAEVPDAALSLRPAAKAGAGGKSGDQ